MTNAIAAGAPAGPPDFPAMLERLHQAAQPGQTLDRLETSVKDVRAAQGFVGDPGAPYGYVWRVGEAKSAIVEQLSEKAELAPAPFRRIELRAMKVAAKLRHTTVVDRLVKRAQAVEHRDLGFF